MIYLCKLCKCTYVIRFKAFGFAYFRSYCSLLINMFVFLSYEKYDDENVEIPFAGLGPFLRFEVPLSVSSR